MKPFLQSLIGAALASTATFCSGQAPTISYSGPQIYQINTSVFLSPASNGVAARGYGGNPILVGSGINSPTAVTLDVAGNVYATGFYETVVKEVPVGGGAQVIIGSGFAQPFDVAIDAAGNIYVADLSNNAVKKIPAGSNTPVAIGSGFSDPAGVAVDAAGNVFVADYGHNSVKEILKNDGSTVTIGSGFSTPTGVAVDVLGNVYVSDYGNNSIKKIPAGSNTPVAIGSGFSLPNGVSVDASGNVFVADFGSKTVKEILAGGNTTITLNISPVNPYKTTTDGSGNLYVADFGNGSIEENVPTGGYYIDKPLPVGLVFNNSTGTISGTPTVPSAATFYTITAYNSHGSTQAHVNIQVKLPPPPVISYNSPQSYLINTALNISPASSGVAASVYGATSTPLGSGFNSPTGVAIDAAGNIYVSSFYESTIKKIPVGGGAPVSIGSGFTQPFDVAVDAAGNLYVADLGNNAVKKIPAGSNTPISIGSGFSQPAGVAVDAAGNVYVADYGHSAIKEIKADNSSTFTLGSGFSTPAGVAVDAYGNVYVADYGNNAIKKIPAGSNVPVAIGTGISLPNGLVVDASGNVFEADYGTNTVKEILAGTNTTITLNSAVAVNPYKVTIDGAGDLIVADFSSPSVKKTVPAGGYYINKALPTGLTFNNNTGGISGTPTVPSPPTGYIVTAYNNGGGTAFSLNLEIKLPPVPTISYNTPQSYLVNQAVSLSPSGINVAVPVYGNTAVSLGSGFSSPTGVAVDTAGNIYVVSFYESTIKKIPAGGGPPVTIGEGLSQPFDIAVDPAGNLYVADLGNNQVKKFPAGSDIPVIMGTGLSQPAGVAVDAAGNIYVADYGHNAVKVILADNSGTYPIGSGFATPTGVAVDPYGNLYISDYGNNAIKRIAAGSNTIVTIGTGVSLPNGVAVDPSGNVFEADYGSNTIKEILAGTNTTITVTQGPAVINPYKMTIDAAGDIIAADFSSTSVKKIIPLGGYYINQFLPKGLSFNNTTGNITGTPTAASPLTDYTVSAYSAGGRAAADVKIQVNAAASTNALLSALTMNGTLSPAFAQTTYDYTVSVSNSVTDAMFTPTTVDGGAYITINGIAEASGATTEGFPLVVGPNTINILVTAQDGLTTKTYTLNVLRKSNDATLSALTLSSGTLSPAFSSSTITYTASVGNSTTSITLTPTKNNTYASIAVNGSPVNSGTATQAQALVVGLNVIKVVVTAQNGAVKTYTVTVTRKSNDATLSALTLSNGTLSPAFAGGTVTYVATVGNSTSFITLTPTQNNAYASITVNGAAVVSGTASTAQPLAVGANPMQIVVTAQNGAVKTYTVTVTRMSNDATLSALTISSGTLNPVFAATTITYTATVGNSTASITLTPTKNNAFASISVNQNAVSSGTASAAIGLAVGSNPIQVVVTAQNGAVKTYTVTVTRMSNDATLSALTLSSGTLSPAFASSTVNYSASVSNGTTSIKLTPNKNNIYASITVNGAAVASGTASAAQPLAVGANAIQVKVTAQNGAVKTYTVTVTRAATGLNSLYLPGGGEETPLVSSLGEKVEANNILSPNGDGINDIWVVKNIAFYPNNTVSVYDRAGKVVFTKKGYTNDWDGNYRGSVLSEGTYYYTVDLGNGTTKKGFITVVNH